MNESSLANDLDGAVRCNECGSNDTESDGAGGYRCNSCRLMMHVLTPGVRIEKCQVGKGWMIYFESGRAMYALAEELDQKIEEL